MKIKKIKFIKSIVFFFILQITNLFGSCNISSPINIVFDENQDQYLKINSTLFATTNIVNSPTLCYISIPEIKTNILSNNIRSRIEEIGTENLEKIINEIIAKELELSDEYFVFYHGQKREFLLLQDLYTKLYEFFNQKNLKDFHFIRIPNKKYNKFKTPYDFLFSNKYKISNSSYPWNVFDNDYEIKRHILAVNVSLFGNSLSCINKYISECTFKFFIRSDNITNIDFANIYKEILDFFKRAKIFNKYKKEFNNLLELLSEFEKTKTGNLIQIFIPKNLVNKIMYRSFQGGTPFYGIIKNPELTVNKLLQNYSTDLLSILTTWPLHDASKLSELDEIQFRILLTNEIMLNPESGVKIFRYTIETENIKIYKKNLDRLINTIIEENEDQKNFLELFIDYLKPFVMKQTN